MIDLVLADDWELRGDGSGNMRTIQFATMRRLCELYERHGLRASFNVEVMQQLAHRRLGEQHPELAELALEWEDAVREAYEGGHDVQLHLHPQWSRSSFVDGRWSLEGSWSILDYAREEMESMLRVARDYLHTLLQPLDGEYRCRTFRSGSWCIAPNDDILEVLAGLGFVFDMSVIDGAVWQTAHVHLDYRMIDEPFLPFFPRMEDARRVAGSPQPIICVPTHSFRGNCESLIRWGRRDKKRPPASLRYRIGYRTARLSRLIAPSVARSSLGARWLCSPSATPIEDAGYDPGYSSAFWAASSDVQPTTQVSDLASLSFAQMREMLRDIRLRARASGVDRVPVILENHTKDIGDFRPIERFARYVARAPDLRVMTLSQLARDLTAGAYPIVSRGPG